MAAQYGTFGSYILFKKLLSDAYGQLYRAAEFDKSGLGRTVFLRIFDGQNVPHNDLVSRVETATSVAGVLKATNIVGNAIFTAEDGVAATAWDFIAAQPLSLIFQKVEMEGFPVPIDNSLLIMEKLALALSVALSVDVGGSSLVHGFLHPGMIMVTNDGEGLVAGFGIADQLLGALDHSEIVDECAPFLAPEVLATRTASKRGDVYSLGAILYTLLTDKRLAADPEGREGVLEKAELSYEGDPIPDDIKALLSRALAHRPEERFSSAADFKKELDKLLYGGNYSPTTFNLALFMDRLFRAEIELEEKDRAAEQTVDVDQYFKPEPEPEPEEEAPPPPATGKGLWIGLAAALAAIVIAAVAFVPRLMQTPATPTPTPEELAAQQQAQQERMRAMVDAEVQRMMAEQEDRIRKELTDRQTEIEQLQRQLREAEAASRRSGATSEEQQKAEELKRELAAAEEAKRQREQQLEAERLRAADEARRQAEAVAQEEAAKATPEPVVAEVLPTPTTPPPKPTATPEPQQQRPERPPVAATVVENQFVDPSEVSSPAEVIKRDMPTWSRGAMRSKRRGVVILQVTVNARGKAEEVKVLRSDHRGFSIVESAVEAAKGFIFKPAFKDGVKVKTYTTVTVPYDFSRTR